MVRRWSVLRAILSAKKAAKRIQALFRGAATRAQRNSSTQTPSVFVSVAQRAGCKRKRFRPSVHVRKLKQTPARKLRACRKKRRCLGRKSVRYARHLRCKDRR